MDIIYSARQSGKTCKCIAELLSNPDSVLVVGNISRKFEIGKMCPIIVDRIFVGLDELYGEHYKDVIIDNADGLLKSLICKHCMNLKMITINKDKDE